MIDVHPDEHELDLKFDEALQDLLRSLHFVVLARCAGVGRAWRSRVNRMLGQGHLNSLQARYSRTALGFAGALPAIMMTHMTNVCNNMDLLQSDTMMRTAVTYLVQGFEVNLLCWRASVVCIQESDLILNTLQLKHMHPGVSARPTIWMLMRVLCAFPGNVHMGLQVMRLIQRYGSVMQEMFPRVNTIDIQDTVVLSDAMLKRAIAVINNYEATLRRTLPTENGPTNDLKILCEQVRKGMARGARLITGWNFCE